ncbi:hypothetical protein HIM_12107 [Hirsutella minnesotensis 3608]|uniref:Reverse transcriptase domain-containing protein n=1 Tax=Hirsutella minnesotensis 3608 TaxID=1043627 RepID=A0A0F7ZF46_9HYPO|nr:hypothetical protein HIM_12107 [Hirsutella minnesotensis 3608]
MPDLTLQEIEEKVMAAKPWKAPREDGLPAIVWKKLWQVVKVRVWTLFDSSLREGVVPHQWRTAKIIPLRKPGKGDYTLAKAWRMGRVLNLISFDVKGAYNAVCKERLLDRMGHPGQIGRLDGRILLGTDRVGGCQRAHIRAPSPAAGRNNGGSIAFVDDYSAWVTGPTAESNRDGIQSIIDDALDWEKRSGATFASRMKAPERGMANGVG